ncbi:MAG: ribonuclease P protein component [Pseudomonadota bacterium]
MKKRADFLAANSGRRAATPGFVLLGRDRKDGAPARFGFTCSKKVGNSVTRNRAKRRLRALAREVLAPDAKTGWDYIMIGRRGSTTERSYQLLIADLRRAVAKLHAGTS